VRALQECIDLHGLGLRLTLQLLSSHVTYECLGISASFVIDFLVFLALAANSKVLKWIKAKWLADYFVENSSIVKDYLGRTSASDHPEISKNVAPILAFLAKHGRLGSDAVLALWDTAGLTDDTFATLNVLLPKLPLPAIEELYSR
jgi:hypothetical protein